MQAKVRTYVNDHVIPLVNEAKVDLGYVERHFGRQTAAEYAANLADLGGLLQATPEIFVGTVTEQREARHGIDAEAKRVIDRLRPVHARLGSVYTQRLDTVQNALSTQEIGEAVT